MSSTSTLTSEPGLVLGASGFLGREVIAHFERRGRPIAGTFFTNPRPGLHSFDLRKPDVPSLLERLPFAPAFAVIAAATTDMDLCRRDWEATSQINVDGTVMVASQLQAAGIVPVFISSDYVYDGETGHYGDEAPRRPILAYGSQKKSVEDALLASGRPFIVVRAARVYSLRLEDRTLLTLTLNALGRGETLRMATDQMFNPSYVEDVCRAIELLVDHRAFGCHNLGPAEGLSRFELATLLKDRLEIRTGTIVRCLLRDLTFGDARPADTTLDSSRFTQATGYRFVSVTESIQRLRRVFAQSPLSK